jgi:hypothetical protein
MAAVTGTRSQLFTVRLWAEETAPARGEYRGEVTHLTSGARRPFRDWTALETFFVETLAAAGMGSVRWDPSDQERQEQAGPGGPGGPGS